MTRSIYIAILVFCFAGQLPAANHYIRDGATGSNDGSDWTNAWEDWTDVSSFTRSDTYYVADGTYVFKALTTSNSGTTTITIKKATEASHGSATGWSSAYGDGQSVMAGFSWSTDYWIIDGVSGSGREPSSYGFRISRVDDCNRNSNLSSFLNAAGGNTTVQYVAFVHCTAGNFQHGIINSGQPKTNITIAHNLFAFGTQQLRRPLWSNSTIEYNYFRENHSETASHGGMIGLGGGGTNNVFRYNVFEGARGTAAITYSQTSGAGGDKIYGNIFFDGSVGNGSVADTTNGAVKGVQFYNNTMVNIGGVCGLKTTEPGSNGNISRNNLYYNCNLLGTASDTSRDYNTYILTGGTASVGAGTGEPNSETSGSDPFVSIAGDDFHLTTATGGGQVLASPFDTDPDSKVRGADGVWDRGAFEHVSDAPNPPCCLRTVP